MDQLKLDSLKAISSEDNDETIDQSYLDDVINNIFLPWFGYAEQINMYMRNGIIKRTGELFPENSNPYLINASAMNTYINRYIITIRNLEQFIAPVRCTEDIIVTRNINENLFINLNKDDIFHSSTYMSTTTRDFSDDSIFGDIKMSLKILSGQHCFYLSVINYDRDDEETEQEILIPPCFMNFEGKDDLDVYHFTIISIYPFFIENYSLF